MVRDSGKDSGKTAQLESLHAVDVFEFARNHNEASGVLNLDAMPRMLAEVPVGAPVPQVPFAWRLSGSVTKAPGADGEREERWLTLAVKGSLWLECQRCLGPYEQALAAETRYLIVDTDAEADARPMDDDEADVVVGSRQFDLIELIEEELLLSLPLVPKHEMCPSVHDSLLTGVDGSESSFDENEAPQESEKPNPFAALKALKGDGSGSNGKGKLKS
jgi:uncharacterized protein